MENLDEFRPVPFYYLNTTERSELTRKAALAGMTRLKSAGYGGCVLFNKPPTGFDPDRYLSGEWFETVENFLLAAQRLNLKIWINDGWDYPPGDAGNRIAAIRPDLKQRRLVKNADGKVEIREVEWGFPAFEEPESSRLFITFVYEEYRKRLGSYFNDPLVGFFSDADNRRSASYTLKELDGKAFFPWTLSFPSLFREQYGYEVEPHLPEILDGGHCEAAADYWRLCSELYQNWFRNNYEWCRTHGLKYSFHTSDTGPLTLAQCLRTSVFSEGETLRLASFCDYPGTDHELAALDGGTHFDGGTPSDGRYFVPEVSRGGNDRRVVNPHFFETKYDVRAKYVASAAFLNRRERVLCESYAAANNGSNPGVLRHIAAWQILQGINFFVPQAVHHRYFGSTKFFAPPEFIHGTLRQGVRELNDWIAKYSRIAAAGEYEAKIAVIDPNPEMWKGRDAGTFFEICDFLNRNAYGYVIVDREHANDFPFVLDPLSGENPELPVPEASFDGGTLAWMLRRLPDGGRFLLAANLWSGETLQGTLTFEGRRIELELAPGEIAVIGGPYEEFRAPFRVEKRQGLAFPAQVTWNSPNSIPFHFPAEWTNLGVFPEMSLKVPSELAGKVCFDRIPLLDGTPCRVFDDSYVEYRICGGTGIHRIDFPPAAYEQPLYLCGEFDVELEMVNEFYRPVFQFYNMKIFEPEKCIIRLKKRSETLNVGSWADQGAPFYSGGAVYSFQMETEGSESVLVLPDAAHVCEVEWDGKLIGRAVWPPFRFPLGRPGKGRHKLAVRVWNTLANQLEEYRAPSGLIRGAEIVSVPPE